MPRMSSRKSCFCIAAAPCRWKGAPCSQATTPAATSCRSGPRRRRRTSPAQRLPICSSATSNPSGLSHPCVGGGFGTKAPFYAEEAVIPAAAMKLDRPVTWQEDRREHFLSATQERDQHWRIAVAVDAEGRLLGVRGRLLHDTGAFLPWGIIAPYIAATTLPGPYVLPAYRIELTVALTNRVPTTVVRGAGRPQAVFAMERLMDRIARELQLDRAQVRRRNMIRPEQMPYSVGLLFRDGKPLVYASGDFPKSQERALTLADYEGFRTRQTAARAEGRYLGIGIGNYVEGTGLGPFEGVTVRVLPNGKVAVATGATSQGQGTSTTLAQIIADEVGCAMTDIVMTAGDTAAIAQGVGAFASRQAVTAGSSARIAGANVRGQIVALAARVLGVPQDEIDLEDGRATARAGNKPSLSLGELARLAQGVPGVSFAAGEAPGLEHTAYFSPAASLVLQWHARGRSRSRSVHRRRDHPQLHRGARQRDDHQSPDRRRASAGRRRPWDRQRLARVDEIRCRRATLDDDLSGLPVARGARRAGLQDRACGDAKSAQPARRQGRRRGRHHSGASGNHRRHRGCAFTLRRALCRDAVDARPHCRGAAQGGRL